MDDLALAVAAARAGRDVVAAGLGGGALAEYKAADNPVTVVDRDAEAAILAVIGAARPSDHILSEEGGGTPGPGRRWIVDPLDGTVNFLHGIPQVGVAVALYDGDAPLVAAVLDVTRGEEFTARRGDGAYRDGSPIRVGGVGDLGRAVIATGFPYDHKRHAAGYAAVLGAVLAEVQGIRRMGSAVLDLAWLAAGRYDGFWELGLQPWDLAAGILLITEAGGQITTVFGQPATPETGLVVAAAPALHEPLRRIVAAHLPPHLEAG